MAMGNPNPWAECNKPWHAKTLCPGCSPIVNISACNVGMAGQFSATTNIAARVNNGLKTWGRTNETRNGYTPVQRLFVLTDPPPSPTLKAIAPLKWLRLLIRNRYYGTENIPALQVKMLIEWFYGGPGHLTTRRRKYKQSSFRDRNFPLECPWRTQVRHFEGAARRCSFGNVLEGWTYRRSQILHGKFDAGKAPRAER